MAKAKSKNKAKTKAKSKRKTKVKAASKPNFCAALAGGIKQINKDLETEGVQIIAQQRLIAQLTQQNANPKLIQQAQDRLKALQQQNKDDLGQLEAFQDEFDAECS
jgi:methionine synthase II (cobalamin-independent)